MELDVLVTYFAKRSSWNSHVSWKLHNLGIKATLRRGTTRAELISTSAFCAQWVCQNYGWANRKRTSQACKKNNKNLKVCGRTWPAVRADFFSCRCCCWSFPSGAPGTASSWLLITPYLKCFCFHKHRCYYDYATPGKELWERQVWQHQLSQCTKVTHMQGNAQLKGVLSYMTWHDVFLWLAAR